MRRYVNVKQSARVLRWDAIEFSVGLAGIAIGGSWLAQGGEASAMFNVYGPGLFYGLAAVFGVFWTVRGAGRLARDSGALPTFVIASGDDRVLLTGWPRSPRGASVGLLPGDTLALELVGVQGRGLDGYVRGQRLCLANASDRVEMPVGDLDLDVVAESLRAALPRNGAFVVDVAESGGS